MYHHKKRMKFNKKLFFISFSILLAINLAWNIWLYFLPTHTTIWNYLYNGMYGFLYLLAAIIPMYYAKIFGIKSSIGKMLLYIGLAMLSFEVGQIMWVYYNLILKVSIPFPSWADLAFMIYYPLLVIGIIYLLKIYKQQITKEIVRDSTIIFIISFILIFGFFSRPDISANLPFIQKFINVYYPMGDVLLLAMALIALRIAGGKIHPSLYLLSAGLFMQTAADVLFTYRNAKDIYWNGDISDLLYTICPFLIGVGLIETIYSLSQSSFKPTASPPPTSPPTMSNTPAVEAKT